MKATFNLRRKWILDSAPLVTDILLRFPFLKEKKYVS